MKIDIQKAYNRVDWVFFRRNDGLFKFSSHHVIKLVMKCVSTPKFSLMFDGSLHGYFASKRGLRQGDRPVSTLLSIISMILKNLEVVEGFSYHPRCRAKKLTHLWFDHDLILCCKGDFKSIYIIHAFKLFSDSYGLKANIQKLAFYYSYGMNEEVVQRVKEVSNFQRSKLPFKYLGVPICSKKIYSMYRSKGQCLSLMDPLYVSS